MRAQMVDVRESTGRILCCTIFRQGGKKLLAKGHIISNDDVRLLETEGMEQVWVTELEEGEVGEDEAVLQIATEMGCGSLEIKLAAGGRANLIATESSCILVDDELLKQINCTSSVVIATQTNFTLARSGQRIATVKSAPFAVAASQLETVVSILKERGPILQARPVRSPVVAVLYADPVNGERARQQSRRDLRERLPPVDRQHAGLELRELPEQPVLHARSRREPVHGRPSRAGRHLHGDRLPSRPHGDVGCAAAPA